MSARSPSFRAHALAGGVRLDGRDADLAAAPTGGLPGLMRTRPLRITVLCLGYVILGLAVISDGVHRADHVIQIA
jgi:hypothetical protein